MKITGDDFVQAICNRLRKKNVLLYDSNIRNEIESLTWVEMNRIIMLGEDTPAVIKESEQLRTTEQVQNAK